MADKKVSVFISAVDQVTGPLREIQASVKGFASGAKDVLLGLGAAFGAAALGSFFRASIEQANQADEAYRGLGVALNNLGLDAAAVRPDVDKTVQSLARLTGADDSDLVGGLARLVGLTGDYRKSLTLLPVALDVAAARAMPLSEAIDLVGKTANGSLKALALLGLHAASGAEGVELLARRFSGAAAATANPLQRLRAAWNDVKEAMGRALLGSDQFGAGLNPLLDALVRLEQVIVANEDRISAFVSEVVQALAVLASWGVHVLATLIPVGVWLGTTLVRAWQGGQIVFIELAERVANIGPKVRLMLGATLEAIANFVASSADLFDAVFGTHIATMVDAMANTGRKMRHQANVEIAANRAAMAGAEADVFASSASSSARTPPPAGRAGHPLRPALDAETLRSLQDQVKLAQQMTGFTETRVRGLTQLAALEQQINTLLKDRTLTDKDRLALLTQEAAVRKAQAAAGEVAPLVGETRTVERTGAHGQPLELRVSGGTLHPRKTIEGADNLHTPPGLQEVAPPGLPGVTDGIHEASAAWAAFKAGLGTSDLAKALEAPRDAIDNLNASLGELAGNAITNLSANWGAMVDSIVSGSQSLGSALTSTIQHAIGAAAKSEGQHSMVKALDDVADFLAGKNPAGLIAAAKHVAAGTAFFALGAALGSGGGSGGSVTAGGGGGLSPDTFTQNSSLTAGQGTVTVVLPRGAYVHPESPEFQAFLADTIRNASGRNVVLQYQGA